MAHQNFDFNWKIAYERLVEKVRDQLKLLEEPIVNGEISSATLAKIIKKLIQDEQNKASTLAASQLQSQPQPQSKSQFSSSSQTDCVQTFKPVTVNREEISENVTAKETLKADSAPNPETEVFVMENATVETLNLDDEKIEFPNDTESPTAQTPNVQIEETDSNIESTDSQTSSISNIPLELNQNQNKSQCEQEIQGKEKQMQSQRNKKAFKCPKCPYRAKWKANVKTHVKHVHLHQPQTGSGSSRPFPCSHPGCNYAAKQKLNLTRHMTTHSGEKSFVCSHPNCEYSTTRSDNLKIHSRSHTGEKPYVCQFQFCTFATTTSSQLVNHFRIHTKERPFKCTAPNCEYSATSNSSLTTHRQNHERKRKAGKEVEQRPKFQCPLCEYSAKTQAYFSSHMKTHSLEKPFACSFKSCEYRYKQKASLNSHSKTHSDEKQYKCELCPFRGKTRGNVLVHIKKLHCDPKSWTFKCKEPSCDFTARTKRHLERHLLTHSQNKKYACSFPGCDYLALAKQSVKMHEIHSHTLEKKEKCRICDYVCKQKSNLTTHMRTHRKEEPYKCKGNGCEYRAKTASNLNAHQKKHHPHILNKEDL